MPDKLRTDKALADEEPTDEQLMERFYAGDTRAWRALDDRHRIALVKTALRRLPPIVDRLGVADELANTALSAAAATRNKVKARWNGDRGPVAPWLSKILHNKVSEYKRQLQRQLSLIPWTDLGHTPQLTVPDVSPVGGPEGSQGATSAEERLRSALRAYLGTLRNNRDREILRLLLEENLTSSAVARQLGLSDSAVRKVKQRRMRQLRPWLAARGFGVVGGLLSDESLSPGRGDQREARDQERP